MMRTTTTTTTTTTARTLVQQLATPPPSPLRRCKTKNSGTASKRQTRISTDAFKHSLRDLYTQQLADICLRLILRLIQVSSPERQEPQSHIDTVTFKRLRTLVHSLASHTVHGGGQGGGHTRSSVPALLHSVLIARRICSKSKSENDDPLPHILRCPRNLLLAGIMLAEAQSCDGSTKMATWDRLAGTPTGVAKDIRMAALVHLDWDTLVKDHEYDTWVVELGIVCRREVMRRLTTVL